MQRHLLIDGDIILYECMLAATDATEWLDDEGEPAFIYPLFDIRKFRELMAKKLVALSTELEAETSQVYLTDPKINWRKAVLPTYKGNRKGGKPIGFTKAREVVEKEFGGIWVPTLEADDLMGLKSSEENQYMYHSAYYKGGPLTNVQSIIVSADKDLTQIPGYLFNPQKPARGVVYYDEEHSWRYHMLQTIMGDRVDGYTGCPGIGEVRGKKLLDDCVDEQEAWDAIVHAYDKAGLTEDHALVQARVARMLQHGEFNFVTGEVTLWEPR
jgi:DNA polymerase-1